MDPDIQEVDTPEDLIREAFSHIALEKEDIHLMYQTNTFKDHKHYLIEYTVWIPSYRDLIDEMHARAHSEYPDDDYAPLFCDRYGISYGTKPADREYNVIEKEEHERKIDDDDTDWLERLLAECTK